jgi:hypothetical protein
MNHEVAARLGLSFGCATELDIIAGSKRDPRSNLLLSILDEGIDIATGYVEGDGLNAASAVMQNHIPSGCLIDVRELSERNINAFRILDRQSRDGIHTGSGVGRQHYCHRKDTVSLIDVCNLFAFVGRMNIIENTDRVEAPMQKFRSA